LIIVWQGWSFKETAGSNYHFSSRKTKNCHGLAKEHWYIVVKFDPAWHEIKVKDIMGEINWLFEEFLDKVGAQGVHIAQNGDITVSLRPFAEMTADAISDPLSFSAE
jgi:hypothetical protein